MADHILRRRVAALAGVTVALVTMAVGVSGASSAASPHIVATPNNVMVNGTVKLVGTHFAPHKKLVLKECGATTWIAPQDPCDKAKIKVKTNAHGRFSRSFAAALCPRTKPWKGHPVTEERCYVGEIMPSGVDVINLVGHVRIIVTYP